MSVSLFDYQAEVVNKLKNGSILYAGVGSGKSITSLAYFFIKECGGELDHLSLKRPIDLYIITTAQKRDKQEWDDELSRFLLKKGNNDNGITVYIDSWNNIKKYADVDGAFFIFDEDKVTGSGAWVKTFLKITKKNGWIILTATPGDTWTDYIPVFIANGFYKNRTEFIRTHVIYNRFTKYPKVDRYINVGRLVKYRSEVLVRMKFERKTVSHKNIIEVGYDKAAYDYVMKKRWNIFEEKPIESISELCYTLRKITNINLDRVRAVEDILKENDKVIIFYNFDYELYLLRDLLDELKIVYGEMNSHNHDPLPSESKWVYLVNYMAGSEAWNCTETNTVVFYSQNYSYKTMIQSSGRIDRTNTPYKNLYYYTLISKSPIDIGISKCLRRKKNFNESAFME